MFYILKKIGRWLKIGWLLMYIVLVTIFVGWIAVMGWLTLSDDNAINNPTIVNYLSISIGLASLPGAFIQLITVININEKKEYFVDTKCHVCRHDIQLTVTEK